MKRKFTPILTLILLAGIFLPAGCGLMTKNAGEITPLAPPSKPEAEAPYPGSPEEVVMFFIDAYSADPATGMRYLTPRLTATLDGESALHLLPDGGTIPGYQLQEGATSLESQTSNILVEFTFADKVNWVEFNLTQLDGKWMIDSINAR